MLRMNEDRKLILGIKRFLSDYFGFTITALSIEGVKRDKKGTILLIQFAVHAPALDAPAIYIAAWREDMGDWELKRL